MVRVLCWTDVPHIFTRSRCGRYLGVCGTRRSGHGWTADLRPDQTGPARRAQPRERMDLCVVRRLRCLRPRCVSCWIARFSAQDLTRQQYFPITRAVLGGGAWGPGGVSIAPDGRVYAATGNATTADNAYWSSLGAEHPGDNGDYFEAVCCIDGAGNLAPLDWYQPGNARAMNDKDLDLGGSSIVLLPPLDTHELLVTTGKDGYVYLLDRKNLGHWAGERWRAHVFAGESKCAPAYSGKNNLVYVVGSGTPGLEAFRVVLDASSASLQSAWPAKGGLGITLGDYPGSPLVMSLSGTPQVVVWIVDDTGPSLRGFDALSGVEVFASSGKAANALGPIPHFPPISCGGTSVLVGLTDGLACFGPP